jgi:hypothetical protein
MFASRFECCLLHLPHRLPMANLPENFPHWRAVHYYFEQWKKDGTFQVLNEALNSLDRIREGREPYPSQMCIDSQSIKLSSMIFEDRGLDADKKINGRKRHLWVDCGGRLWAALVGGADEHDGQGGCDFLEEEGWRIRTGGVDGSVEKDFGGWFLPG